MISVRTVVLFAAAFVLAACAPVEAPANETGGPVEITMTRTVCFGYCPAYTVTITGDGEVTYVGRQFVNVTGEQHATIPSADVARLVQRFDEIGFDSLRDAYRANITDLPTTTISISRDGRQKTVVDYGGTRVGLPQEVRALQSEIDRVAGTDRWVLRDGQPVRTPPQP